MELKLIGFHPSAGPLIGTMRNIVFPCTAEYGTRNEFASANRPMLRYYIDINGERFGAMWFVTDNEYINKLIDRLWADYKQSL